MATKQYTPPPCPENGLSDFFLKNLKRNGTRYEISDNDTRGLRIRVNPGGTKSFIWRYRDGNSTRVHIIGTYGNTNGKVSLSAARKNIIDLKDQYQEGNKPSTTAIDTPKNVAELCEVFYTRRILPYRKRPDVVRQMLDADVIPKLGKKRLSNNSITAVTLSNVIDSVVDRGAATHAGKVLAIIKQIFSFAESKGYMISPANCLKRKDLGVQSNTRTRALDVDQEGIAQANLLEVKALWNVINIAPHMSIQIKLAIKILLLTGVRTNELRLAKWQHLDFTKSTWFIPQENTKNDKAWTVPLSPLVLDMFTQLKKESDKWLEDEPEAAQWVLSSPESNDGCITDKAIGRATRRLFDLKDNNGKYLLTIPLFSPHDFRRTLRSHLGRLKVPPHISEKCLNHSLGRIDSIYDKNTYIDERREALEKWANVINLAVLDQPNITQLVS